ncbi:FIST N-terminal domain-containing protein [Tropicimonas sp. IMCC34043]|uniref:FIST N-terminal domain-containing protein n=1 Tax=Tropicimonas sp. IMCC34043 TaxID=2248760 RepID=UPI000E249774|nr:FIST N-terminal domain-containing protein [Tropicimonas sp. IMCC34043]
MDQESGPSGAQDSAPKIVRAAMVDRDTVNPVARLARSMGEEPLELVALFISPRADIRAIALEAQSVFEGVKVIGCTTAGEISSEGYSEGKIVAVGLPKAQFRARCLLVEDLSHFDGSQVVERMSQARNALRAERPEWSNEFNFMLIDGMSKLEDALTAKIAAGLGPVPLFGGSAGDEERFGATYLLCGGRVMNNAAVVTQVRTACRVEVFKTDHFVPTDRRMVITRASPERRIVHEINAEPAAREYARLVGKDPYQMTSFTFAAHPLVVRVGGQHHVRSIQQVAENGDLIFFSAIDEGLVLTLAEATDMAVHLEAELAALARNGPPDTILACECIFRRIEAEQKQMSGRISQIFRDNRVIGFSTYGEQINSMHVNQTLTGVAIYPPEEVPC